MKSNIEGHIDVIKKINIKFNIYDQEIKVENLTRIAPRVIKKRINKKRQNGAT